MPLRTRTLQCKLPETRGRLGGLAPLLYHYVEVSPNTIANPEKRNNYSTKGFKGRKTRFPQRRKCPSLKNTVKWLVWKTAFAPSFTAYPFQTTGAQGYLAYCFSSLGMCCRTHFPSRLRRMFHSRYFLPSSVPQCPMYGVARKMDYATLGAAREQIDPAHRGIKLVCR